MLKTRQFYQPSKKYYLKVGDRLFEDTNLDNLRRMKHNYKTSPHFKGVFISPIFDSGIKNTPLWMQTGVIKRPAKQGK